MIGSPSHVEGIRPTAQCRHPGLGKLFCQQHIPPKSVVPGRRSFSIEDLLVVKKCLCGKAVGKGITFSVLQRTLKVIPILVQIDTGFLNGIRHVAEIARVPVFDEKLYRAGAE